MPSAIVLGASGATGSQLVKILQQRGWQVKCVTRRPLPGLECVVVPDLSAVETSTQPSDWKADWFFNAIGTTRAQAGGGHEFAHIERDISLACSKMAKLGGVPHASVVSAGSASENAPLAYWFHPLLYSRIMYEKENAAVSQQFASVSIFRPGMLDRERNDRDSFLASALFFLPRLKVSQLALAMVKDAEAVLAAPSSPPVRYYSNADIAAAL